MLGYELSIKEQLISASIGKRCISIIVKKENGHFSIRFSGSDFTVNESMVWYESELKIGDKMTITIKDVVNESIPAVIEKIELQPCSCDEESTLVMEALKRKFEALKRILMQRGISLP